MEQQEIINTIALTRMSAISLAGLQEAYQRLGSATAIIDHHKDIREVLPDATNRLVEAFQGINAQIRQAEEEYEWATRNKIEPIAFNDPRYPQRMRNCQDAPLLVYYRGSSDLNPTRCIAMIGTRHCTTYGQDIIRHFMQDLRAMCPETLVMSGLAYGIDINAHREALRNGLPTIGVVAHGLDQIYPRSHRDTAIEMLRHGGLLTEYPHNTVVDKINFVRRNRIVAGMADATILVESASKGGGLITMGIARDYNRDCFAFPGPVNAEYSKGCNNIIRDNGAALITSAEDFVKAMCWSNESELQQNRQKGIERQIFPDLTPDEEKIVRSLQDTNDQQLNLLTVKTDIPISKLTSLLFSLEMKGVIKTLSGGCYHLL